VKKFLIYWMVSGVILLMGCKPASPKNIILLIGDGMGTSQITAAKYAKGTLEMERCPVGGLVTTHSSSQFVTDSAASGTAMATGHKTENAIIGQAPDGQLLKNVLEIAEEKGKATGLVCTSALTHATPASFSAHIAHRDRQPEIAEQIAAQEIEVLFGGGRGYFIPKSSEGSLRLDEKDLLSILSKRSKVVTTEDEFRSLKTPERVVGLFAQGALPTFSEGRISLPDLTTKAIELLALNDNGFFLMVEGSQIDWGGHATNAEYVLSETVDFDDAVGAALDFAEKDGNTLVIVTADHETGGYALLHGSVEERTITKTSFAHNKHTATMVPLFAYGPGSQAFGGIHDNTDVGRLLIKKVANE
jgi:alkaline phosphatase